MKYYAGIGSRETPDNVLDVMEMIAGKLAHRDWVVRSGGAPGADRAFIQAARAHGDARAEIYLPWEDFEGWGDILSVVRTQPQPSAFVIAEKYHAGWEYLKPGARKLIARNTHQVLGYDVIEPVYSKFVICWTPQGKAAGGTGQAIRIAKDLGIPVYDLGDESTLDLFLSLVL